MDNTWSFMWSRLSARSVQKCYHSHIS